MSAAELKKNQKAIIKEIVGEGLTKQRLMDLGFIPNQEIKCMTKVLDTYALKVMGSQYGLRKEAAEQIILES